VDAAVVADRGEESVDRLAQPDGQWRPFDRSGAKGFLYRDPYRE